MGDFFDFCIDVFFSSLKVDSPEISGGVLKLRVLDLEPISIFFNQ